MGHECPHPVIGVQRGASDPGCQEASVQPREFLSRAGCQGLGAGGLEVVVGYSPGPPGLGNVCLTVGGQHPLRPSPVVLPWKGFQGVCRSF